MIEPIDFCAQFEAMNLNCQFELLQSVNNEAFILDKRKVTKYLLYFNSAGVAPTQAIALLGHIVGGALEKHAINVSTLAAISLVPKVVSDCPWEAVKVELKGGNRQTFRSVCSKYFKSHELDSNLFTTH